MTHWHPSVLAGLGALLALYLAGIGPLRRRYRLAPAAAVDPASVAAFAGGVLAMSVALSGPLAEWAEHVAASAHMLQHLVLTLAVPPLWLMGTPGWLLRPLLRVPGIAATGYVLTRPAVALVLAGVTLVVWHVPVCFDAALRHEAIHIVEHLTLLGTALLAWWPLLGPLREWPRPPEPAQLLYVLVSTLPMTAIASFVTLADRVLYPFYAAAQAPWPLAPRGDQELAGTLMWIGGMLVYLAAGTVVFFRWAAAEARAEAGHGLPLSVQDV